MPSQYIFTPPSSDSICGPVPDEAEHFQHLTLISTLCPWCLFTLCHSERPCCLAPSSKVRTGQGGASCRPGGTVLRCSLQCCLLQSPANTTSVSKAFTANGRAVRIGRCAYKACLGKIKQQLAKIFVQLLQTGEQVCGKGFGDPGGQQAERGPAASPDIEKANSIPDCF